MKCDKLREEFMEALLNGPETASPALHAVVAHRAIQRSSHPIFIAFIRQQQVT